MNVVVLLQTVVTSHLGRFKSQRELEEHWESNIDCALAVAV